MADFCSNHGAKEAMGRCATCATPICSSCAVVLPDGGFCCTACFAERPPTASAAEPVRRERTGIMPLPDEYRPPETMLDLEFVPPPRRKTEIPMCARHPTELAKDRCLACGKGMCRACLITTPQGHYCSRRCAGMTTRIPAPAPAEPPLSLPPLPPSMKARPSSPVATAGTARRTTRTTAPAPRPGAGRGIWVLPIVAGLCALGAATAVVTWRDDVRALPPAAPQERVRTMLDQAARLETEGTVLAAEVNAAMARPPGGRAQLRALLSKARTAESKLYDAQLRYLAARREAPDPSAISDRIKRLDAQIARIGAVGREIQAWLR